MVRQTLKILQYLLQEFQNVADFLGRYALKGSVKSFYFVSS